MMVMLFAIRVISQESNFTAAKGDSHYIPTTLRQKVADCVINDFGVPDMVPTTYGGTLVIEEPA